MIHRRTTTPGYCETPSPSHSIHTDHVRLYAASVGHKETIKKIALALRGSGPRLLTSVSDRSGNSVFALAVLRGHLDVARFIFTLSIEQYNEDNGSDTTPRQDHERSKWMNRTSIGLASSRARDPHSVSLDRPQVVKWGTKSERDPRLLLEGLCRPEAALVNSTALHSRQCTLFGHAVSNNDVQLLSFLIQLGQDMVATQDGSDLTYHTPKGVFLQAIRLGRQQCLEEIIKCVGAGLIEHLHAPIVYKKARSKHQSYEGLSGTKKQHSTMALLATLTPPVLLAARQGKLGIVQWFLGSAPRRLYTEFVLSNGRLKSLQWLINSSEGPENLLGNWLSSRSKFFARGLLFCSTSPLV